jgi:hypothetical protein
MSEWYKAVFGKEPREPLPPLPERVEYGELNGKTIEFVEDHPRAVSTSMGPRAVIRIRMDGREYSLWLSRMGLASEVARLEQERGSLMGLRVRVEELPKRRNFIPYRLTAAE